MAYNIKLLNGHTIGKKKYFFDSNIWLIIVKPKMVPTDREQRYIDFVENFKTSTQNPKIVIPALMLSEIINRYLHDVGMPKFKAKNPLIAELPKFYKEHYRQSDQFKIDYELICDDIKSYNKYYELIPDNLGIDFKTKHLLSNPPKGLDFNDHYYYLMAKKRGYTIVTDDADFFVEDVDVLTYNNKLYKRGTDSVIPKI